MLQTHAVKTEVFSLLEQLMAGSDVISFALAGGTGLALHMGHRISVDLDLFTSLDFEPDILSGQLRDKFKIELQNSSKNKLNLIINGIKVDLLAFKYPMLKPLITDGNIRLYSLEDIAALKLSAVSSRGSKKDFNILYYLLNLYSLSELLNFYQRKFETDQY